ncbi:hypothetical protein C0Q96_21225 [Streptomyces albidoflavus]|nr:hypothetical protein STALF2_09210 [Streptomyces albidoflavus]QXQ30794.1 hypothetical protein STALF4_09240 [Streptomyces albidoflavus]RZE23163.1 hypothetical protein C0Q96_21225 [Streptomyces albidoflavus]
MKGEGVGQDLTVDIELLTSSEKRLGGIKHEFESLEEWKSDVRAVLGSDRMSKAMGTFVDNWDRHRKTLIGDIEQMGGYISTTRKAFEKVDRELAEEARKKRGEKRQGGGK